MGDINLDLGLLRVMSSVDNVSLSISVEACFTAEDHILHSLTASEVLSELKAGNIVAQRAPGCHMDVDTTLNSHLIFNSTKLSLKEQLADTIVKLPVRTFIRLQATNSPFTLRLMAV